MFIRISLRVPIYDSTQFTSDLFKHSSQKIPFGIPFITVQDTRVCKLHADCVVRIVDTCFTEAFLSCRTQSHCHILVLVDFSSDYLCHEALASSFPCLPLLYCHGNRSAKFFSISRVRCAENVVGNLVFTASDCLLMLPALLDVVVPDVVIGERCLAPVAQQVVLTVQSTCYVGCVIRSVAQSFWVNMLRQQV